MYSKLIQHVLILINYDNDDTFKLLDGVLILALRFVATGRVKLKLHGSRAQNDDIGVVAVVVEVSYSVA